MTKENIKKYITAHQNPDLIGFAAKWSGLWAVAPLTRLAIWLGFQAEEVCFSWIVLGVLSGILFGFGNYWLGIGGLVLFHLSQILDGVDGAVARYRKRPTVRGAYLDMIGHPIVNASVLLGLGIGVFMNPPSYILLPSYVYLIAGGISATFMILVNVVRLKVFETLIDKNLIAKLAKQRAIFKPGQSKSLKKTFFTFFRIDPFSAFYFAVIFDLVAPLILVYAIFLPLMYLIRGKKEYENIRRGIDEAKEGKMTISLGTSKH